MSKICPSSHTREKSLKIQEKLEETRQQIYFREWGTQLLTLSCWGTAFWGTALGLDHWSYAKEGTRFLLWGIFWGGALFFFCRNLLPLFRNRIHPLYAADVLEKENPQLKNRLLNLLFLKNEASFRKNEKKSALILASLEQQTLLHLNQREASHKKGKYLLLQQGILLGILLTGLFCYTLFSPKSSWTSVKRILFPWETIAAPTRVWIEAISPGNCAVLAGETLMISAGIANLHPGEEVTVIYSTRDRQVVNRTLPMKKSQENQWEVLLGDWPAGIQTPLTWKIQAGDALSESFQVEVAPPLRMEIEEVLLTFPDYMQLPPQKGKNPDFQGWEGTEVMLQILASHAIESGYLEMWPEQNPSEKMRWKLDVAKSNPRQALVQFPLQFSPWNLPTLEEATQETFFYTLHYTHENHVSSSTPPQYQVTVLPDLYPQIRLTTFPEEGSVLPWGTPLELVLEVEDPDFALRGVAFRARWNGKNLDIPPIFNLPSSEMGVKGVFRKLYRWNPTDANLKPGDSIQWWVEAIDDQLPEANRAATPWRRLHWAEPLEMPQEKEQESAASESSPNATEENENQIFEEELPQNAGEEAGEVAGEEETVPGEEASEKQQGTAQGENLNEEKNEGTNPQGESKNSQQQQEKGDEGSPESQNEEGKTEPKLAPEDFDPLSPENASSQDVPSLAGEESSEAGEKNEERNGKNLPEQRNESTPSEPSLEEKPSEAKENGLANPSADTSPISEETSPGEKESPGATPQGKGEKESEATPSPENARPGMEEGASSQHDFDQPGGEKEDFHRENLRESDNLHQENRDSLVDNSLEGGDNSASTPKDGESDPGGAFEEILKHQQKTTGKGDRRDSGSPPEKAEEDGGDWEMEKQNLPTPSENAPSSQESGKASKRTGNDTQKGDASSRPESMRDLSTEGSTRERDRMPGTQKGGQEDSQQQGIGRAGNHTPNEEGNPAGSGGDGPLDSQGGEGKPTDEKTGFSNSQQAGKSDATRPSKEGTQKGEGSTTEAQKSVSATPSLSHAGIPSAQRSESRSEQGSGWSDGKSDRSGTTELAEETAADQANAEYARRQTLLALNHLQDMLQQGDETILKQLGWSREEAMAFLQKWRQIHHAADEKNLSALQRQQLERTFRNLGLPPQAELEREASHERRKVYLHNTLQVPPPEKWREMLDAYSRGVAEDSLP